VFIDDGKTFTQLEALKLSAYTHHDTVSHLNKKEEWRYEKLKIYYE
jgi:hypothetical protein